MSRASSFCKTGPRARRRRKSSAVLWAIRNSQPSGLTMTPRVGSAARALISASWTMSSPSTAEPVMRAQYRWSFGRSSPTNRSNSARPLSVIRCRLLRLAALCESYVERLDVAFVAKAVGDTLQITRIAEELGTLFPTRRRGREGAITLHDMLVDADTHVFRAGSRNLMAERGAGNKLQTGERLEGKLEGAAARY